jgi:hypothetical protein
MKKKKKRSRRKVSLKSANVGAQKALPRRSLVPAG